jgi:hypothetical protein
MGMYLSSLDPSFEKVVATFFWITVAEASLVTDFLEK